ncbi:MAG: hypothetical protein WCP68_11495 [Enhydrobacter sp.]
MAKFGMLLANPIPPQCYICERNLDFNPGNIPWWVGKLSRVAVANSSADPRRYRRALTNPAEPEQPGRAGLVAICETCCPADTEPNEKFRQRTLTDQAKRDGGMVFNESPKVRFSPTSGRA